MSEILIKHASSSDLEKIIFIYNECIEDDDPSVAYETRLDPQNPPEWLLDRVRLNHIIVEEQEGMIRGFAHIGSFSLAPNIETFCQMGVYVSRNYRKSLIAARLMLTIIQVARNCGKQKIFSFVLDNNKASLRGVERVFSFVGVLEKIAFVRQEFKDIHFFERNLVQGFVPEEMKFYSSHVEPYFKK